MLVDGTGTFHGRNGSLPRRPFSVTTTGSLSVSLIKLEKVFFTQNAGPTLGEVIRGNPYSERLGSGALPRT